MEDNKILSIILCESDDTSSSEGEFDTILENAIHLLDSNDINDAIETILLLAPNEPKNIRNCINFYIENVVSKYTEVEFRKHFRISPKLFSAIATEFGKSEIYSVLRDDKKTSPEKHILVFLWFAGHEAACFRDIGDRFDLSISTVSAIITRVTVFLSNTSPLVIKWPNAEAKKETADYFMKSGFPYIIGAIDGTHINIEPPARGRDSYINRKGRYSIQLQAIANHKRKFINIFVGYPGSTHDSRVLKNSYIYPKIKEKCGDYLILGDSAYPLMENLITPYRDNGHLSERQKHFNKKLSSCRVVVEHSFGILKQRFRQLYGCKLRGVRKLNHFIRACCVLHNLADEEDLPFDQPEIAPSSADNEEEVSFQQPDTNTAKIRRNEIARLLEN